MSNIGVVLRNPQYVAFVFSIVAHKNVDVDACFMAEVVEITAGDIYAVSKDERGRERKRVLCCITGGALCMRRVFNEFCSLRTGIRASMQREINK